MSQPRIVATPDGPALQIPAGAAALDAAAIGRYLAMRPAGNGRDPQLSPLRAALLRVEEMHARGEGFASETGGGVPVFEWVTSADLAALTGVTAQAVTKACRLGRIPGAHLVAGHGWFVPTSVLPDLEDDVEQDDAA